MFNLANEVLAGVDRDLYLDLNSSLFDRIKESNKSFGYLLSQGFENWIITFSGGKDSTTTLILALEYIIKYPERVKRVDIVYCDTLVEIPSINEFSIDFLEKLKVLSRIKNIPLHINIVKPQLADRYWVKMLGYGYPPPHQKFRWCTRRLKITPVNQVLKEYIIKNKTAILTGVRFGESKDRDIRLNNSCIRGGECGQGLWFEKSQRLGIGYMAPIINWPLCDVWDFLIGFAPHMGYPTLMLKEVYNGHDTRFGCWTCTVVKQDKAMLRTIEQKNWKHLKPLYNFRIEIWETTRLKENRIMKPNNSPGKINKTTRAYLLNRLIDIQNEVKIKLISSEEINFIKDVWSNESNPN